MERTMQSGLVVGTFKQLIFTQSTEKKPTPNKNISFFVRAIHA
jgi:hypothetical protein